jgi:hypothetical protein
MYLMNADGTGQVQLTNDSGINARPAWSPDGTKITFDSNRDGHFQIYVTNADGSGQTRLTNGTASDVSPNWQVRVPPALGGVATYPPVGGDGTAWPVAGAAFAAMALVALSSFVWRRKPARA